MKAVLAAGSLAVVVSVILLSPSNAPAALVLCALLSAAVLAFIRAAGEERQFLTQLFAAGLLLRLLVGALIHNLNLETFFGGDAYTYDILGRLIVQVWQGDLMWHQFEGMMGPFLSRNWGMIYVFGVIYAAFGRNMLAVQAFSAVLGAATAPIIFLCARHIFQNLRVARLAAYSVAFFPSLVLWSAQGLKDGPLVFLLAVCVLLTLRLARKFDVRYLALLAAALFGIFTLRFYVFYMMVAAIVGSFALGLGPVSAKSLVRQFVVVVVVGLALTQLGVLRSAETQFEAYGNLEAIQRSRADLAKSAESGFGKDVDVSTASGALTAIPLGMLYLLFAPFPWQLASLRQLITLPEMLVWWGSFPLLVTGLWFTLKHRMRHALPILIFTTMLTLAYSVFQGNVGTAYRQRSQLLIFYFIFASVGYVLVKERKENKQAQAQQAALAARAAPAWALVPAGA
ncbi:MAG TPA: glycosyltransferase family 39 protein, partial [Pyrinomonadaceae bacterium]|nr:glycosyltransferase family 39 protein [Pyrinomonadaceae bacterium]